MNYDPETNPADEVCPETNEACTNDKPCCEETVKTETTEATSDAA